MCKGICHHLFVVVLCLCALSAAAWAQEDVNEPWDPAEHFVPYWESVELEARLYNPARKPEADPNTQRRLSIQGAVEILDYDHLIGVNDRVQDLVVLDQDGAEIYSTVGDLPGSRWYRSVEDVRRLAGFFQRADEFRFGASIPMDPNRGYPTSLSRIEWSTGALIAETFAVVDVPFEPNETWIELVPGLEILVEEASVEEGKYAYKIQAIYDRDLISYSVGPTWHFWREEVPPATLLLKMDMLNAAGQSVRDLSSSGGFGSGTSAHGTGDGLMEATSTGHGSCSACGNVTTIRYTFALEPYEQAARFVLEDIPVPSF